MNNYHLFVTGPESLVLQELISDKITSLENDLAEFPDLNFDDRTAMEAELIHCRSMKTKLEQLFPEC